MAKRKPVTMYAVVRDRRLWAIYPSRTAAGLVSFASEGDTVRPVLVTMKEVKRGKA